VKDFKDRIPLDWHTTLSRVLDTARAAKDDGVLVFDLDSTVFDNRPRQARIVREFGAAKGIGALERCQAHHLVSGWELWPAFVACGLPESDAKGLQKEFKKFWGARFFTSEYCADDIEVVGAPRYVHACVATGARVAYVTGRQESMREGTVTCLARCGLPVPGGTVSLVMKPLLEQDDDGFKRTVHSSLGRVLAAFDNEPIHANDYARRFPEAIVVHLATDHSNREPNLDPRIVSIPHFAV
jgi:hypothetical protein